MKKETKAAIAWVITIVLVIVGVYVLNEHGGKQSCAECLCTKDCNQKGLMFSHVDFPPFESDKDCYCWDGNQTTQLY